MSVVVRHDLAEAHRLAWRHIAEPGSWWRGAERVELAATALHAIADRDPLPPWVAVAASGRLGPESLLHTMHTTSPIALLVTPAQ